MISSSSYLGQGGLLMTPPRSTLSPMRPLTLTTPPSFPEHPPPPSHPPPFQQIASLTTSSSSSLSNPQSTTPATTAHSTGDGIDTLVSASTEMHKGMYILPSQLRALTISQLEQIFHQWVNGPPSDATKITFIRLPSPGSLVMLINLGRTKFPDGYSWKKSKDYSNK